MKTLVKKSENLFPSFPSFFDDFLMKDLFNWSQTNFANTGSTVPSVNILETKDDYRIDVAAPGMKKEDFRVELENNLLIISSEWQDRQEAEEGNYTRREFSYQSFQRSFTLPENVVDADKIHARYKDGILHLVVPKKEEAKTKPVRTIQIK